MVLQHFAGLSKINQPLYFVLMEMLLEMKLQYLYLE